MACERNPPSRHEGMARILDQIRASKLPSNLMQFAARGALQVPAEENIEILVYLALHNKVFGDLARMTLAGWDEKASQAAAANPQTAREVLDYFISPDNLRPMLLPMLLENPAIAEGQLVKLAIGASRESIEVMLKSKRVQSLRGVLEALKSNPYVSKEEVEQLQILCSANASPVSADEHAPALESPEAAAKATESVASPETADEWADDEALSAYLKEHAHDIAAEGDKPFQAIGGVFDVLAADDFAG